MKKIQSFASLLTILSLLIFPLSPLLAQVDAMTGADMTAPSPTPEPEPVMETVAPTDATPPVISDVSAMSLGLSETTISWSTDELATSKVRYGKTSALGQTAIIEGSGTLMHATTLMDLESGTTYHYCIDATDNVGNMAESCGHTFVTNAEPVPADTMPPTVSEVTVSSITTDAATVGWKTDEVSSGYVEYGMTADYGSVTMFDTALSTDHSQALSELSPDTEYHYRIIATDEAGNETATPDNTFTTEPLPPPPAQESTPQPAPAPVASTSTTTTMPESNTTTETVSPPATTTEPAAETLVFHSITPEDITHTSVTIGWETNLPADSLIEYGETADLGISSTHSTTLTTEHEVTITGLAENTRYYFRVVSKPSGAATASASGLHEFTTLATPIVIDPAADITSVGISGITENGAVISATTSEPTGVTVEYGTTTAYEKSATMSTSAASHTITLTELTPGTKYHYRVKAVDAGGNETYSIDRMFTTNASSIPANGGGSTSTTSDATSEEVVSPTPPSVVVSGGGVGMHIAPPGIPLLITAAPLDSEIMFIWNNPTTQGFTDVKLVRKEGGYPTSPTDGEILYYGRSETFTDTGLTNDHLYHYALYAHNAHGEYSSPLRISLSPKAGIEEVKVEKVPVLEHVFPAEHFGEHLEFGDRGQEVIHLQQLLNVENVHDSKLTTGYFGPLTRVSIKKFQDKHGLSQTGMADVATRAKLTTISEGHIVIGAPGAIAALDADLKRGDSSEHVGYLQEFLAYEGSYPDAIVNQLFGPLTQKGVIAFQEKYGVIPTIGYVGFKTRHTIQHALGL